MKFICLIQTLAAFNIGGLIKTRLKQGSKLGAVVFDNISVSRINSNGTFITDL